MDQNTNSSAWQTDPAVKRRAALRIAAHELNMSYEEAEACSALDPKKSACAARVAQLLRHETWNLVLHLETRWNDSSESFETK